MTTSERHPRFLLLRATPASLLDSPPLASSLQSVETSLLLLAHGRAPHALAAAAFAVESALKAARRIPVDDHVVLADLLRDAVRDIPALRHQSSALRTLRRRRNDVVHYGFSPDDDDECTSLLLRVALPTVNAVYVHYFDFDVTTALFVELGDHLRIATDVERLVTPASRMSSSDALIALGQFLRVRLAAGTASPAEDAMIEHAEEWGLLFEQVERRRQVLERALEPCWTFDCPVCESVQCLVTTLGEGALARGEVEVERAVCARCDLHIPGRASALTAALLRPQVDAQTPAIRQDYGL